MGAGAVSESSQSASDGAVVLLGIRDTPLSVEEVLRAVSSPAAGGIALFVGAVRESDGGREVQALGYSAHPGALAVMRQVARGVVLGHPALRVAAVHRVGELAVGDVAVVVAAAGHHRGVALEACRALIDELKDQVPIWKHQRFTDGTQEWVGSP
jgi:molybdopterin synthase catalytic subunit